MGDSLLQKVKQKLSASIHWNFYRLHLTYMTLLTLLGSVIIYGSGGDGRDEAKGFGLAYIDALTLSASATTSAGNIVNSEDSASS